MKKQLLPRIALNIITRLEKIPQGDIKPLLGRKGEYRLWVGKYRIVFFQEDESIYVVKIDTRGDVYKIFSTFERGCWIFSSLTYRQEKY